VIEVNSNHTDFVYSLYNSAVFVQGCLPSDERCLNFILLCHLN